MRRPDHSIRYAGETMNIKRIPRRALIYALRHAIRPMEYVHTRSYMRVYPPFLKWVGHNLIGPPAFISPTASLDRTDPSLITLGKGIVISTDVHILTHDFSVACVDKARGISATGPVKAADREPGDLVRRKK